MAHPDATGSKRIFLLKSEIGTILHWVSLMRDMYEPRSLKNVDGSSGKQAICLLFVDHGIPQRSHTFHPDFNHIACNDRANTLRSAGRDQITG